MPGQLFSTRMHSPIGELLLVKSQAGLRRIAFDSEDPTAVILAECVATGFEHTVDDHAFAEELHQLSRYFSGDATGFTVTLDLPVTGFRQRVQHTLATIPYAETASYGEVAAMLNNPGAARAVGTACATNPIPVVLPCHRVLSAGGALGGYSGGIWRKRLLLELEGSR